MIRQIINYFKKHKWIFQISASVFVIATFWIRDDTRNFIWNNGIIILLIILPIFVVILITIIIFKNLTISQNDISAYNRLMNLLNLQSTEYILRDMQNNLPIELSELRMLNNFVAQTAHVNNRILNKKLNKLMMNFGNSLAQYLTRHATYTVPIRGNSSFLAFDPDFKENNHELYESRVKELDDLASEAYGHLGILMNFAAKKI